MKKNLYYRNVIMRSNAFEAFILNFFLAIASWPRLVLEVFIRKNFGERYFSLSTVFIVFTLLALFPVLVNQRTWMMFFMYGGMNINFSYIFKENTTWYLFLLAFLLFSIRREGEITRSYSSFDLARFSLSSGEIHPRILALYAGKEINFRTIETIIEPAFCFLVGLVLWLAGQGTGIFLMVCSIIYSLSYVAAYRRGDSFVLDHIDELICNYQLAASFIDGVDSSQTQGFRFIGPRPSDPEMRRKVAETFFEEEEEVEAR